jgi:acyl-CoA synthetase (AMP-forming)/AMP-acid ligase II
LGDQKQQQQQQHHMATLNLDTLAQAETIHEILRSPGEAQSDRPVLLAPGRKPLSWAGLCRQIDTVAATFAQNRIGTESRVAVVLPDGPELATAFLSVTASAAFAPLNPAYKSDEFDFYLTDLQAKALLVGKGQDSPARAVARKRGVPILEVHVPPDATAGQFVLQPESLATGPTPTSAKFAAPESVALVLHTSGTTSRPKIVPLTHRNLCSSARHIAATLKLGEADRSLCVMPLFHIHGLIAALFASICGGGSVVCPPGFLAPEFFSWLREFSPTWFSAVPTMHQAILARAEENQAVIKTTPLRFIRSSSAALPPGIMRRLEETFGVPVIEAYGMTEASHQMASNPLPPGQRKPGSVGHAAGPEIAIMDKAGQLLAAKEVGEIVIRGPNVTRGYDNNPAANAAAFSDSWFRTGDQGYLDPEGYLYITGRLKEIINRGGEKIAPREVDEVLLNYPGVRQAVAFAVVHPTLGEDLAAAIVGADGHALNESELRAFAAKHLPAFKVPSRIVFLKEIPKGPTGKIQRIGLGDRLAQELSVVYEAAQGATESLVVTAFEQVLRREGVGRRDNFFFLGGESLRGMQVTSRLSESLGVEIPAFLLFRFPTAAELAPELERRVQELDADTLASVLEKLPPAERERLLNESSLQTDEEPTA